MGRTPRYTDNNKPRSGNEYAQIPLEDRRPRLSKEASIFNAAIDDFVKAVEIGQFDIPSDYNLLVFLREAMPDYDVSTARLAAYREEAEVHGFGEGFNKLRMFREHFWEVKSLDNRSATTAIFHLKQPENGGYQDKQDKSNAPVEVKVTINGCSDAFK